MAKAHRSRLCLLKIGLKSVLLTKVKPLRRIYLFIFLTTFLPDEFVLKKYIVALVIALNILLCKFNDAFKHTDTSVAVLINITTINKNVKIANIMIQLCLEMYGGSDISSVVDETISVAVKMLLSTLFDLRKTRSSKFTLNHIMMN